MGCFGKEWYGSVHENGVICPISDTPIQRIGLTNCAKNSHLCFAPPCDPIPFFGDPSDSANVLTNDSLYFLFDFPSIGGDNYTLERYNFTTKVWSEITILNNIQGVKYTFGDAIFNDKYENRSGYRLDAHLILSLYGEGMYRFVVKDSTTYEDSLFSTCFCAMHWDCDLAKRTTKIYTNFTGVVSDWKNPTIQNKHDLGCMDWTDSRRYNGLFKRIAPTIEQTIFVENDNRNYTHKSKTIANYNLELLQITIEARVRLFKYGGLSREIFATDYNEDIVGISEHWTAIRMPNVPNDTVSKGMPNISLSEIVCSGRYDLIFDKCISCEPPPPPFVLPDPLPVMPFDVDTNFVLATDGTSLGEEARLKAEQYAFGYITELKIRYPQWTGNFYIEHITFGDNDAEDWLSWARIYCKNKGLDNVVLTCFIDESHIKYTPILATRTTVPSAKFTQDYNDFVFDYANYYTFFKGIVYGIPAGDPNLIPPPDSIYDGTTYRDWYLPHQLSQYCAIEGGVVALPDFIPSQQGDISLITIENQHSILGAGLKDFGWKEYHSFSDAGINDPLWTYQVFKSHMDGALGI